MLYADVTLTSRPPLSPFTVLLNAHAGRGLARRKWPALQAELERRAIPFTLLETASADEARRHMQTLAPGTPVMTVGGDGTVACAAAIAVAGPIGFLALAAPQLAHRWWRTAGLTVGTSALLGAGILAVADFLAEVVIRANPELSGRWMGA